MSRFTDEMNKFLTMHNPKTVEADNDLDSSGLPINLETHHHSWRDALVLCMNNDFGNKEYWKHEIRAFDHTMKQLQEIRNKGKLK